MIKFRRNRKHSAIYWDFNTIPAWTFFSILFSGDYSKMGTAPAEELESAFDRIYDLYTNLEGEDKVMTWYKKRARIALINLQITTINNILYGIIYLPLSQSELSKAIDSLNSIKSVAINFDPDKKILDEIQRVQRSVLGVLRNRLNIEMAGEKEEKEAVEFSFHQDLVAVENILGRSIDDTVTLIKYVELQKAAKLKAKQLQKQQSKTRKHGSK